MQRATVEVTWGFHHRRPTLQLIRKIIEERSVKSTYTRRLMDYNNDPKTKLKDGKSLFAEALARMGN